jgi:hypothetical protein
MKLDDSTEVVSVILVNVDSKVETKLFEKEGSVCHFKLPFRFEDYLIQFRLDWSAAKGTQNGDPMLDVDIWPNSNNNVKGKNKFLPNGPWHHTDKKFDSKLSMWIYEFQFNNLRLRLATKKTMRKTITANAVIVKPA